MAAPFCWLARRLRDLASWRFDGVVMDGGLLAMALNRPLATKHLTFTAVFEPAEEGGYVVTFPAIPNLATQGETLDEARALAEDCLRCYLGGLSADGLPLPDGEAPREAVREAITVDLEAA